MNFAAIHKLPVVFCCENNGYAISVPQEKQMAVKNVADRAAGYGMPGTVVDGNDPLAVNEAARTAVECARSGGGPSLVEIKVYRYLPHTSTDDDRRYRSREEVEQARARDPIVLFRKNLVDQGLWDAMRETALQEEIKATLDDALAYAETSPSPTPADAFRGIYAG